jgi:hypothetical protein
MIGAKGRLTPSMERPDEGPPAVLLIGAPRSGTTWVGKILDSHPDVLYRHEPDSVLPEPGLPRLCMAEDVERLLPMARAYLARLVHVRHPKAAGTLPVFAKSFRSAPAALAHAAAVYGLRAAGAVLGKRGAAVAIPDLRSRGRPPVVAVKSVNALGRAGLFAQAAPETRIILLLRHPCGQVASRLRGAALGLQEANVVYADRLRLPQARRHGLVPEAFARLPLADQLAWNWALMNEKAMDDLGGRQNVLMVRYEDVCADPIAKARELMAFAGLGWSARTEAFIRWSSAPSRSERYYQTRQDPIAAAGKWRRQLSGEQIAAIMAVASRTAPGTLYAEAMM